MSLANKLSEERRGRLAAERLLELKQAELFAANRKLGNHARQLTNEIVETRAEVENVRTENQKVKSDLSAAHQKIEQVERRLWQSMESITDGFAFFNPDSELIMANRAYLAVFEDLEIIKTGVNYVTILQMLTDEGIVDVGDMRPDQWRQMMTERMQDPEPEPKTIRLWNGEYIKMIDRRGTDGDIISLGINITATVEYEEQLEQARQVAESANRAKSAFLANMSHEIRTPMNGVVGMADVLIDTELDDEQRLYVDTIKNSGEALLVIINDVLDYSKIEAEKLELHPEPFDLERAILEVIMLLQPTAWDKGLVLTLDYDVLLPSHLVGDLGRLRQVLTNLMGNAVKFTTDGHVAVLVTGKVDENSKSVQLEITIEDTGIGIPSDMVGHIFGEFNQVENERNRKFDGTGLGLAISKRLINMMGGEIWVTSEEGTGSRFSFRVDLPLEEEATIVDHSISPSLRHVMVVDDFEPNRTILQHQLEKLGLKATACPDAATALALLDKTVDLVLTDHLMPGTDGFELAETARAAGHKMPIFVLSSNPGSAHDHPARHHVQEVVQRPFARKELLSRLNNIKPADIDQNEQSSEIVPTFSHRRAAANISKSAPEIPQGKALVTETEADTITSVPEETDHTDPDVSAKEPPPISTSRQMRVLAAEDNKTNQLVFRKMVKALNIDLKFAADGLEAVELYKSFAPDLIFMDISMPKMDGKDATQAIRALEQTSGVHVPIVALTAHAMEGDDTSILSAGLDYYLTKPLRKPAIWAQISDNCPADAMPPEAPLQDAG